MSSSLTESTNEIVYGARLPVRTEVTNDTATEPVYVVGERWVGSSPSLVHNAVVMQT